MKILPLFIECIIYCRAQSATRFLTLSLVRVGENFRVRLRVADVLKGQVVCGALLSGV